jgi:hypothetical protein
MTAVPAPSCWRYAVDSGVLDRLNPRDRQVAEAAYGEGDTSEAWDSFADDQAVYLPAAVNDLYAANPAPLFRDAA